MRRFILGHGVTKAGTTWMWDYLMGDKHFRSVKRFSKVYQKEMQLWHVNAPLELNRGKINKSLKPGIIYLRAYHRLKKPKLTLDVLRHRWIERRFHNSNGEYYFTHYAHLLKNGGVAGDLTPGHAFLNEKVARRIMHSFEQRGISFRSVYSMRDPVRRAVSHFPLVAARKGYYAKELIYDTLEFSSSNNMNDAFRVFINMKWQKRLADYKKTIETMIAAYPQEQRMFVLFEEMVKGVKLRELSDFLGVSYRPETIATPVNPQKRNLKLNEEVLQECAQLYRPTYEAIAKIFPQTEELWSGWKYLR